MDQLAKESCCSFSFVRCCLVLRLGVDEEFVDCRVLQVLGDGEGIEVKLVSDGGVGTCLLYQNLCHL